MSATAQFLDKAAEMKRRAQEARTSQERWAFMDLAAEWTKLAKAAEALTGETAPPPPDLAT